MAGDFLTKYSPSANPHGFFFAHNGAQRMGKRARPVADVQLREAGTGALARSVSAG
jgi:hypothetical protein